MKPYEAGVLEILRRHLGARCLAGALSILIACGSDQPPPLQTRPPPPPPPKVTLSLDAVSYVLALGQSVTVGATATGTTTAPGWVLDCTSGQASIDPSGMSATITAIARGTCYLWAYEGQLSAVAIIRIPPLPVGDSCTDDSQCSQEARICGLASLHCGRTCTLACTTDADCPISDAFGHHVPCNDKGLCRLVRDPDESCP